jgi:hypothetical protein
MSEFKSIDEAMAATAADAVQLAAEAGVKLDYSLESVEIVEQQLARLHKQLSEKSPSDREITVMSYRFGTYIAEVLKRSVGGSWSEQSSLHPGYQLPPPELGRWGASLMFIADHPSVEYKHPYRW